ncbi:MAG: hypothetical protein ACI4X9_02150, partial [Kiritimatiellia bacterium]
IFKMVVSGLAVGSNRQAESDAKMLGPKSRVKNKTYGDNAIQVDDTAAIIGALWGRSGARGRL